MAHWNIGAGNITEEIQAYRNQLASKDSHIAAQQTQLLRQTAELEDIRNSLHDALHKLTAETDRALRLESDLSRSNDDLRNEQMTSQNCTIALNAAHDQIKEKDLENRELLSHLETISHTSSNQVSRTTILEKEKATLANRVKELEGNLRNLSSPPITPARQTINRPRSSSLSNVRITTLELELEDVRAQLTAKELEIRALTEKWRVEVMQVENEKVTVERSLKSRLAELEADLEERDEELAYQRNDAGRNGDREEELLKRIDEDEAKIHALEILLGDQEDSNALKETLKKTERQLQITQQKLFECNSRQMDLVQEKEEALDELEDLRDKVHSVERTVEERDTLIAALKRNVTNLRQSQGSPATSTSSYTMPNQDSVEDIERLLNSVQRLRLERDEIRRQLKFLEMEHKFSVDELEKLRNALPIAVVEPAQNQDANYLHLTVSALAVAVDYLSSEYDVTLELVAQRDTDLIAVDAEVQGLRLQHATYLQCLEEAVADREELQRCLQSKEYDWQEELEDLKAAHHETKDTVQHLHTQLSDITSSLADVESERDSLRVQAENLNTDLATAQAELQEAESRYSSLQFHQLSSMTSTEATRSLKEQIEELEKRVVRRTEQIGIHQHDIKRLETNLRLQEERISELTNELDTIAAEKDAMVEDCADAREARDDAITRCEALEMETEVLREETVAVETMVRVVFDVVGQSRNTISRITSDAGHAKAQVERLELDHLQATQSLDEMANDLHDAREKLSASQNDTQQATVALASAQLEIQRLLSSGKSLDDTRSQFEAQSAQLQDELTGCMAERDSLTHQLEDLNQSAIAAETNWVARTTELEKQLANMKDAMTAMESNHREALKDAQIQIAEKEKHLTSSNAEQEQLVQLRMKHAEELGELRSSLVETTSLLEETRTRHAACEAERLETAQELQDAKSELAKQVAVIEEGLSRCQRLTIDLEHTKEEWEAERTDLLDRIDGYQNDLKKAEEVYNTLEDEYQAHVSRGLAENAQQIEQLHGELASIRAQLQARADELAQAVDDASSLHATLQSERDGRHSEREFHSQEVSQLEDQCRALEALNAELGQDVDNANIELNAAQEQLDVLRDELTSYQQDNTALEAQVHQGLSLTRYLESQVKDLEQTLAEETAQHAESRAALTRVESEANSAQINFSMLTSKHQREMSQIQRELVALRNKPDLEHVVAQLEERNNEMEELLRAKCAEIEENDDKTLDMLKENKKLASKVEALSRKVQNLQTKLAAAKASIPTSKPSSGDFTAAPSSSTFPTAYPAPPAATRSRSSTLTSSNESPFTAPSSSRPSSSLSSSRVSPSNPVASTSSSSLSRVSPTITQPSAISRQRSATSTTPSYRDSPTSDIPPTNSRAGGSRATSGSSALPRPKTPERRAFSAFRPPSPEKSAPSSSSKKRALQEDHPMPLPAQAFTPEGVLDSQAESGTPRLQKFMSGIHTGFTPMRHKSSRPIISLSPKRQTVPMPFMNDMTNNPELLDEKPSTSKRGWLDKIRGTTSVQGAEYPSSQQRL